MANKREKDKASLSKRQERKGIEEKLAWSSRVEKSEKEERKI